MSRRRAQDSDECGILLVDKPAGPTSHDVVGWVRWGLGLRRVGHCGTLDPAATGLLVVGVGKATKLATYLTGQDKGYRARFVLGRSTTTADAWGETLDERPCPAGLEVEAVAAVRELRGTHELPPPLYSAVHVDGKRAHERARAGETPMLAPRPMVVHEVEPGQPYRQGDRVEIEATLFVSKGTYIRSLAEALGRRLGVPAHLGSLARIRSGALSLDDPRTLQGLGATPREPSPNGAPRWRITIPTASATEPDHEGPTPLQPREAVGSLVRAHLIDPTQVMPMPVLRVVPGEDGRQALLRLSSGQSIELAGPGLPPWAGEEDRIAVAPAEPDAPGLLIVRVVRGLPTRLQPERVIVPPRLRP